MLPTHVTTSLSLCIDGPEGVGALAAHAASAVAALADTPTQTAALAALRSLVEGMASKPSDVDTARCKAMCETCMPWLVAALGAHGDDADVVQAALLLLRRAAWSADQPRSAELLPVVMDPVVTALSRLPSDVIAVEHGLACLRILAFYWEGPNRVGRHRARATSHEPT